jgi:hypothetical protein
MAFRRWEGWLEYEDRLDGPVYPRCPSCKDLLKEHMGWFQVCPKELCQAVMRLAGAQWGPVHVRLAYRP